MIDNETHQQYENALTLTLAKAARHYAITQNQVYRQFWNRDPQAIIDSLNSDFAKNLQRMMENTAVGIAINAALAKAEYTDIHGVKHYTERCIVVMPEGYGCDGTAFDYTTPTPPIEETPQSPENVE